MAKSKPYRLHLLAWLEIEGGEDWYRQRSPDAAADFASDAWDAIKSIRQAPGRWPKYLHGTRRFVLGRFPFSIVYLDTAQFVSIVAVAIANESPDIGSVGSKPRGISTANL